MTGSKCAALLRKVEEGFARYNLQLFLLCLAMFLVWATKSAMHKAFWFDEWLGLKVATAPTLSNLYERLRSPIDLNPPLYHLYERLVVKAFGFSAFVFRLPALIGFTVYLCCIYGYFSRRFPGRGYGLLAMLLAVSGEAVEYAWEGRPYGVALGLAGISVWAYFRWVDDRKARWLFVLFGAFLCLPLNHYFGVLIPPVIFFAELVRGYRAKKQSWVALSVMVVAPTIGLASIVPLLLGQRGSMGHYLYSGTWSSFTFGYEVTGLPAWVTCLALGSWVVGLWLAADGGKEAVTPEAREEIRPEELVVAVGFLALPLICSFLCVLTHAYLPRYFLTSSVGFVMTACYGIHVASKNRRGTYVLVSAVLLLGLVSHVVSRGQTHGVFAVDVPHSGNPVVFQSRNDYVAAEVAHPDKKQSIYTVVNQRIGMELTGSDMQDLLVANVERYVPENIIALDDLRRISPKWTVVAGQSGWLVTCLQLSGYPVELAGEARDYLGYKQPVFNVDLTSPSGHDLLNCGKNGK